MGETAIDLEEREAGYQAAYSRLATADTAPVDPVAHVSDVQAFVGTQFTQLANADPARVRALVASADQGVVGNFVRVLNAAGYTF